MAGIKANLEKIHVRIDDIFRKLGGPATLKTASPITLTELGRSVSETLSASAWAEERAPRLLKRIADAGASDIQVFAYQYVEKRWPNNPRRRSSVATLQPPWMSDFRASATWVLPTGALC